MKSVEDRLGKVAVTVEKCYWDDHRAYDKLVIVEDRKHGTFISRKPVPIGVSLFNRSYWIPFGGTSRYVNSDQINENNFATSVTFYNSEAELAINSKTREINFPTAIVRTLNSNMIVGKTTIIYESYLRGLVMLVVNAYENVQLKDPEEILDNDLIIGHFYIDDNGTVQSYCSVIEQIRIDGLKKYYKNPDCSDGVLNFDN